MAELTKEMLQNYDLVDYTGKSIEDNLCVTNNSPGLMGPTEQTKLATIEEGAQVNIIDSVSTEFQIPVNDSGISTKELNIKEIDMSKITGLDTVLNNTVKLTGAQTIGGIKTFTDSIKLADSETSVTPIIYTDYTEKLRIDVNNEDYQFGSDGNIASTTSGKFMNENNLSTYAVTSIKGEDEESYRSGDVTITLSNLGVTATADELNHCTGVTSPIQTQINNTVKLTGAQVISGQKTFSDNTQFGSQIWIGDDGVIKETGATLFLIGGSNGATLEIGDSGSGKLGTFRGAFQIAEDLIVNGDTNINAMSCTSIIAGNGGIATSGDILVDDTELESLWSQI